MQYIEIACNAIQYNEMVTLQPTRIFSTLVKGISKARTKTTAAEREMTRPPMKYITIFRRLICGHNGDKY